MLDAARFICTIVFAYPIKVLVTQFYALPRCGPAFAWQCALIIVAFRDELDRAVLVGTLRVSGLGIDVHDLCHQLRIRLNNRARDGCLDMANFPRRGVHRPGNQQTG